MKSICILKDGEDLNGKKYKDEFGNEIRWTWSVEMFYFVESGTYIYPSEWIINYE